MEANDVLRADDPMVAIEAAQAQLEAIEAKQAEGIPDLVEVTLPAEGAPDDEVMRIIAEELNDDQTKPEEGEHIRPITVTYDPYGLGIYVSTALLAYASEYGPMFNGPDQPGMKVTNREAFAKAIGQQLVRELEDGSTAVTRMLDAAIIAAVESGCDGVELTDAKSDEELAAAAYEIEAQRDEVRAAGFAYPEDAPAAPASI